MKVRDGDLQKRNVDKAITGAKQIFNLFRSNLSDTHCSNVIDSLYKAATAAPGYKVEEITPLLMNAYYRSVILNKDADPAKALDAANKFSALGALTNDNYFYKFYMKYQQELDELKPGIEKAAKAQFKLKAQEYAKIVDENMKAKPDVALDAGKKFLAMYDKPPRSDKLYAHVQDAMLAINRMRVEKMQKSKQKRSVDTLFELPAVRLYRSEVVRNNPVPRTPEPLKVTKSLNVNKSKPASKSLHVTAKEKDATERKITRKK